MLVNRLFFDMLSERDFRMNVSQRLFGYKISMAGVN